MSNCRRCGARIEWALTYQGKRMPVDATPRDDGNVAVHRDAAGVLHARVITGTAPLNHGEKRAVAHFATCTATTASKTTRR